MIVILKHEARQEQIDRLKQFLLGMGLRIDESKGENSTILGLVGDTTRVDADLISSLDAVEAVRRVQEPYKKANRKFHPQDTMVDCGGVTIGHGLFQIIAGPCSVESEEQMVTVAMAAKGGVSMLDCPVSGGTAGAKNGTLTMMAAGADELFEAHKPLFESYCGNVVHVGKEVGQGQAFKAVNQLLVGVHMCATAEAFTMARKCGLDLQILYDTIKTSAGTSRIFENRGQFVIDRDFSIRSTLTIQLKDTDIACKTAESVGAPALLGNVARQLFNMSVRQFPPNDDSIEVIRLYEKMADVQVDEKA